MPTQVTDPRRVIHRSIPARARLSLSAMLLRCLTLPAVALACVGVPVQAADPPPVALPRPPGIAPLPKVSSPRLYVIDCGTLTYNRPEDYQLTREEVADTNMSVP